MELLILGDRATQPGEVAMCPCCSKYVIFVINSIIRLCCLHVYTHTNKTVVFLKISEIIIPKTLSDFGEAIKTLALVSSSVK